MRRLAVLFFAMFVAATAFAQVTPIYDIQYVEDPATEDGSPMVGETVTVQGWVTFEPMSLGGDMFFMADDGGPWNGIVVYAPDQPHLGFGWEVEVTGEVDEYYGQTQITATDITVLDDRQDAEEFWGNWYDGMYPALQYSVIGAAGDLSDVATAEQWESCLVRIENVTVDELPSEANYGEWDVTDGNGECAVDNPGDDVFGYHHIVLEGQNYDRIQGPLNYTYSEYKILPEIAWDLKVTVDEANEYYDQVAYFQQVRPMDMTVREDGTGEMYTWDHSYASRTRYGLDQDPEFGEEVVIRALISYPTELGYAGDGAKFIMTDYLQEDTMEPWMSVLSYNPDPGTLGELFEGDEIIFYGEVGEYSTGPSNMTELWITDPFSFISAGNTVPAAAPIDIVDLRDSKLAERWGNVFVELNNVVVTDLEPTAYELFAIDDILDDQWGAVKVDDDSDAMDGYPDPSLGANIESITGWVYHHFGVLDTDAENIDWVYKVCPSYPDDIVIGEAPPNIISASRDYGVVPANQDVVVSATIADNEEVDSATIMYRVDEGAWQQAAMTNVGDLNWEGTLPGQTEGVFVEYYIEAMDDLQQTSTYPANLDNAYLGYWAKEDLTITDVQWTPWANGSSPYAGYDVTVTGVVGNTVDNALDYVADESGPDASAPAYWLQSGDGAAWSGIMVHIPDSQPELGDEIEITGTVIENGAPWSFKYGNNTRINALPGTTQILSNGNALTAYEVTVEQAETALEAHESVLVTFSDVTITQRNTYDVSFSDGTGEFLLDDDMVNDLDELSDVLDVYNSLTAGTTIESLTGVLTYSFGSWKVEVRMMSDFGNVGVDEDFVAAPMEFELAPVYPNPFNPSANIHFSLPSASPVKLIVYNMMGQQVATLIDQPLQAGRHNAVWNASNVSSGTYFLRLVAGQQQQVQKMVLMK